MRQIITVHAAEFDRLVEWTQNPGGPSSGLRQSQQSFADLVRDRQDRICGECGFLKPSRNGPCPNWLNHNAT